MKMTIFISLMLFSASVYSMSLYEFGNAQLVKNFNLLKQGKMQKAEFIDFVNNELHHPLADVYQDEDAQYQWVVSNDKFLVSRGISSIEEINIMKNQNDFKRGTPKTNFTAISAFGVVSIDGKKSGLSMNIVKIGAAYTKTIDHNKVGRVNYKASALFSNYSSIELDDYEGGSTLTPLTPEVNFSVSKRNGSFSYGLKYSFMQYFLLAAQDESQATLNLELINRIAPITSYALTDTVTASATVGYVKGSDISGSDLSIGLTYTFRSRNHFGLSYYSSNLDVVDDSETSSAVFGSYAYSF